MLQRLSADRLTGLALLAFGLAVIHAASELRGPPAGYPAGPSTYPTILGWILLFLAAWVTLRPGARAEAQPRLFSWRAAIGLTLTIVYIAIFRHVGLLVSTLTLLVCYALLLQQGRPRLLDTIVVPVISTLAVYVLLWVLNVPLPRAILP